MSMSSGSAVVFQNVSLVSLWNLSQRFSSAAGRMMGSGFAFLPAPPSFFPWASRAWWLDMLLGMRISVLPARFLDRFAFGRRLSHGRWYSCSCSQYWGGLVFDIGRLATFGHAYYLCSEPCQYRQLPSGIGACLHCEGWFRLVSFNFPGWKRAWHKRSRRWGGMSK